MRFLSVCDFWAATAAGLTGAAATPGAGAPPLPGTARGAGGVVRGAMRRVSWRALWAWAEARQRRARRPRQIDFMALISTEGAGAQGRVPLCVEMAQGIAGKGMG